MTGFVDTFVTCLTEQHDLRIVALAAVICAIGTHSAYAIGGAVARTRALRERLAWGAAGTVATACAIWATHFIAMLAYRPGVVIAFDPVPTLISFLLAVLLVGAGSAIAISRPDAAGRTLGGLVSGLAIAAMHYTGMAGVAVPGRLIWDPVWVVGSVAAGILFSVASGHVAWSRSPRTRALAGTLFLLAVCSAHFLGMAGVSVEFDPLRQVEPGSFTPEMLLVLVTNAAFMVLGLALTAIWISVRFRRQRAAERQRLRDFADVAVEGLLLCDGERITGMNRSLEQMLGQPREALIGRSFGELVQGLSAADVPTSEEREAVVRDQNGHEIPVRIVARTSPSATCRTGWSPSATSASASRSRPRSAGSPISTR